MPAKLDYVQPKKLNPADDLRETLAALEEQPPRLKTLTSAEALAALHNLDRAAELLAQLAAAGINLLPEQARFQAIQAQLKKKAALVLRAVGGPAALANGRPVPAPPPERWWWQVDAVVAAAQRKTALRWGVGAALLALALAGVVVLFKTVLAPSPEVLARLNAENDAMQAFAAGDAATALAKVKAGLAIAAGDPDLLVLQGALQEHLRQPEAARRSFEQAQAAINNNEAFYLLRAQVYLNTNQPEKVEADARAAINANPNSARGWLILGQALEGAGRQQDAALAYGQASRLAIKFNENEVAVYARLGLARLGETLPPETTR